MKPHGGAASVSERPRIPWGRSLTVAARQANVWKMAMAVCLFAAASFAGDPRVIYSKSFPGSVPPYQWISVDKDGAVTYNESTDKDNAENFTLEPAITSLLFNYADKLDHFKGTLESGLKVANMGAKTLRWENGAESSEAKFNYSQDETCAKLTDVFESIAESERLYLVLKRTLRFDKLGVNDALLRVHILYNQRKLYGTSQYLPLFDRVAKDETFLHIARERAALLAEFIRNPKPDGKADK
jgi:hypothetical protein